MVLRKHIDGGIILSCEQEGLDRILKMQVETHNELGDRRSITLMIELMGKYANLILVDEDGKIIDALKRIPPFENSKRLILPQALFVPVEKQKEKAIRFRRRRSTFSVLWSNSFPAFLRFSQARWNIVCKTNRILAASYQRSKKRSALFHRY